MLAARRKLRRPLERMHHQAVASTSGKKKSCATCSPTPLPGRFSRTYTANSNMGTPDPAKRRTRLHSFSPPPPQQEGPTTNRRKLEITWGDKSLGLDLSKGLIGGVKSWLRGQLDDEQTVSYPAHAVGPGKLLRLTVSSRFGDPKTVEITLPPDFVVGRPIRLKGLGRKLGPFTGDLFLRVLAK